MGKPCAKKKKYMTEKTAQGVLDDIQAQAERERRKPTVKNTYKCPKCGFWHLTSQTINDTERSRRER